MNVNAKRIYLGLPQISGFNTTGLSAEWLNACLNECAVSRSDRLDHDMLDIQKLIFIAKMIGLPGVHNVGNCDRMKLAA